MRMRPGAWYALIAIAGIAASSAQTALRRRSKSPRPRFQESYVE
jgi:hypothetical protein